MQQDIYEFEPEKQLPETGIIIYAGVTGSGKTFTMFDHLYYYRKKLDMVIAFIGSVETAEELRKHMPDIFVHDKWRPDILKEIYNDQEIQRRIYGPETLKKIGIFLDDMSYLKGKVFNSEIMRKCACACRHANLLIFCSTQYCKDIPVYMRDNTKIAVLCANKNPKMREKIYESYNPGFSNFKDFENVFKTLTGKKFECMVCVIAGQQNYDISKSVFFYKASDHGDNWKINKKGSWWRTHKKKYNSEYFLSQLPDKEKEQLKREKEYKEAIKKRKYELAKKPIPGSLIVRKHYNNRNQSLSKFYYNKTQRGHA
jgi:hypothetical protein